MSNNISRSNSQHSDQRGRSPADSKSEIYGEPSDGRIDISELEEEDISSGFLESLDNLIPDTSMLEPGQAREILKEIRSNALHKIYVATCEASPDSRPPASNTRQVVGTTTLLIEPKFIFAGRRVGHIEDVSVRKGFENRGIGARLVSHAVQEAERAGCVKIVLDCSDSTMPFYEKLGFSYQDICMKKLVSQAAQPQRDT